MTARGGILATLLSMALAMQTGAMAADETFMKSHSLSDLTFMTGLWQSGGEEKGFDVEELWSAPMGDSMAGYCRFAKEGKTTFYELLTVTDDGGKVTMRMRHFDGKLVGWSDSKEAGDCVLTTLEANKAVFDNQNAEHHVVVSYKREGDRMDVVVTDTRDGKTKEYPFSYKLVR